MPTSTLITTLGAPRNSEEETGEDSSTFLYSTRIPYLVTVLFLFHIALNSNYTPDLIGANMRQLLQERWMQHLTGYGVLLFTLSFVTDMGAWTSIGMSAALYGLFVLTTKMKRIETLIVLGILGISFVIHQLLQKNYTAAWARRGGGARARARAALSASITVLWGLFWLVTAVGVSRYMGEQWIDHGHKYRDRRSPFLHFALNFLYMK